MPTGIYERTEEDRKNRSRIMKKLYKEGKMKAWNKGKKLHYNVWNKGKKGLYKHPPKIRKLISESKKGEKNPMYGKHLSKEHKRNISENAKVNPNYGMKGKHHSKESRRKVSIGNKGKFIPKETRLKMRASKIKYVEKTKLNGMPLCPTIGLSEGKILDKIEKKLNIKIIRQFPVMGYFLDGYPSGLNTAFEIDERQHFIYGQRKERDILRQKEIENFLGCNFVRIKA